MMGCSCQHTTYNHISLSIQAQHSAIKAFAQTRYMQLLMTETISCFKKLLQIEIIVPSEKRALLVVNSFLLSFNGS